MAFTTIKKPSDYFDTRTYSASGAGSISDLNFQPDFIWFKNRTIAGDHGLLDAIRGVTKYLISNSNSTGLTGNGTSSDFLSFDTNGFSYGTSSQLDVGAGTPVTWCWKANGVGSSNTDGSITSTVSANTTSGFSIVKFTGNGSTSATIGHGLGQIPKFIIQKRIDSSTQGDWQVAVKDVGVAYINFASAFATSYGSNGRLNYTGMTSTTYNFGAGTSTVDAVNLNGATYIAYCFAEKQGFSKFGSYTGNGSADGTFVYTGFKPAFVMIKNSSTGTTDWTICDNKRAGYNASNYRLFPNTTGVESTSNAWEMYSNGFKMTSTGSFVNSSANNYIYMAFAEEPLVGDNPATAR